MNLKKKKLKELVDKFDTYYKSGQFDNSSEATARTWIEDFLEIFDWDISNPLEVDQESRISIEAQTRMLEIDSEHKTPDYALMLGDEALSYIDVKKVNLDISHSKKFTFQIRSYGWSSNTPCCFLTNFRELSIYDSRFKPLKDDNPSTGRVHYFRYTDFVENFEVIEQHILKRNVQSKKLNDLYGQYERLRGFKSLDEDFSELLSEWRLKFADLIFKKNPNSNIEDIQSEVQFLLDRIIFLRVAEGKSVEPFGTLKDLSEKSECYKKYKKLCEKKYKKKYRGYLFEDKKSLEYRISDELFREFISKLYFPYPYRFEVVPIELLGNMYEQYLGKQLVIEKGRLKDEFKPEYQKTKGAVYTPRYIVDTICKSTLDPFFEKDKNPSILSLDIIDPACGSGSFLLGIFDYLEKQVKKDIKNKAYKDWYIIDPRRNKKHLKVSSKRMLINSCIYGIDIDPQAIEVSKLSLALKTLEGCESEPSKLLQLNTIEPKILNRIGENIKNGNSLVDSRILEVFPDLVDDINRLDKLRIFDWEKEFEAVFKKKGGFDAVVGNPPYIKQKYYKRVNPDMYEFITHKDKVYNTSGGGQLDIAIPFIERGIEKLNPNGRMSYIVTNRFFKTDYGKSAREYFNLNGFLDFIFDFGELKVFKGRSTYTCIINATKKKNQSLKYKKVNSLKNIEYKLSDYFLEKNKWTNINYSQIDNKPWNFSYPELLQLKESLLQRHLSIGGQSDIHLKIGLSLPWNKVYHIKPIDIKKNVLIGENGFRNLVHIELDSCRPMICNEKFFSFREAKADVYAIFPYDIIFEKDVEIKFSEFCKRFPLAGDYLSINKERLKKEVETYDEDERWHLYIYKKNLVSQNQPKILLPTTIVDTVATVDEKGELYQDNVRIYSMIFDNPSVELYWAVSGVLNSTLINCMAKMTTNPLQEGHVQFNKQFIEPIPFSLKHIRDNIKLQQKLCRISKDIYKLQKRFFTSGVNTQNSIKVSIVSKWSELDKLVENELYKLSDSEKKILKNFPRKWDRFEYFKKQVKNTI